jgi:putative ABC transport system permease protein
METLLQDLRYGVRMLLKRPGFTLVAVMTLALGIGATTAIFSVVNGVLLRDLPYEDEARLVTLWQNNLQNGIEREEVSPANFFDWRDRMQSCDIVAAAEPFAFNLSNNGEPETFRGWIVTDGFFEALGARPLYGRAFLPDEYQPGKGQVVVIGYGLWQRRFGGDPKLIGQQLTLNNQPFIVIGVMPPEFQYPPGREVWAPRQPRPNDRQVRSATFIRVLGRLRPGSSLAQAQAEMNGISAQLAAEYPQTNASTGTLVVSLRDVLVGQVKRALLVMLSAVGCVLLIACANVASLLLVRLTERSRELAIRAALGASRSRLLRQLLLESGLLALVGGGFGVLLADWLIGLILALSPSDLPRLHQVGLDPLVLGFALGISLLTALIFGLAPALQLARPNLQETLKAEGRTVMSGGPRQRLRNLLVVSEIALALILLVGAGLLGRSFVTLLQVNPGFVTEHALALETMVGRGRTPEQRTALIEQMHQRVTSLPGVEGAAISSALPFHDNQVTIPTSFKIEGRATELEQDPTAYIINITPDYLRTLGVPLLQGRELNPFDKADGAPVALINQSLAQRHWPLEEAVGKKVTLAVSGKVVTCEIVGVVGDVRPNGFDSEPRQEIYLPYAQSPAMLVTWVVRTTTDPASQLNAVKEKIREANPAQSFLSIATLDELAERTISQRRFNLLLLGAFGVLALALSGIGLYGLISISTAQRTHEIGLRMALGAPTGAVLWLVIRQGLRLILLGTVLGLAGALALTRLMQSLLFGVSATDPLTFVGVAALLVGVALLACYIPARRATKVDPMVALRYE